MKTIKVYTVTLEQRSTWTALVAAESEEKVRKMWEEDDGFHTQRTLTNVVETVITKVEEYRG